ncbi:MAG: hypothetical protein ACK5YI_16190 [Rhodospirillales bacterium]
MRLIIGALACCCTLLFFTSASATDEKSQEKNVVCPPTSAFGSRFYSPTLEFGTLDIENTFLIDVSIRIDSTVWLVAGEDEIRSKVKRYGFPGYLACYYLDDTVLSISLSDCVSGIYHLGLSDAERNGTEWLDWDRAWAVVVAPEPGRPCAEVLETRSDANFPARPAVYDNEGPPLKRHDCPPVRFEAPAARLICYDTREVLADGSTRPGPQPLGNVLDLGSGLELQIRHAVFEADFRDTIRRFDLLCRYDDGIELAIPVQSGLWGVFGLARHPPAGAPAGTPGGCDRAWALSWTRTGDWPR